jgi:hypothetical protein
MLMPLRAVLRRTMALFDEACDEMLDAAQTRVAS